VRKRNDGVEGILVPSRREKKTEMSMSCKMLLVCAHNGVLQIRQPQWKRQAILSLIRIEKWLPIYCCDCIR
jgi:hypothetical protein